MISLIDFFFKWLARKFVSSESNIQKDTGVWANMMVK